MWLGWLLMACWGASSAPPPAPVAPAEPPPAPPAPTWPEGVQGIDCEATLQSLGAVEGQKLRLGCVAGCAGRVYGTDRYTPDSSICAAAAHAGVDGGVVEVDVLGAADRFVGSTRAGRSSESWTTPLGPTLTVRR